MTWVNVGCGTHPAAAPWINLDTHTNEQVHPDVLVTPGAPLPFDDGGADRVFLGHVLEHVPWRDVPDFLADVRRVLDGDLLVVGPDTFRTLDRWKAGQEPWHIVEAVLEHVGPPSLETWPANGHHWNCHEQRVVEVLELAGFTDVTPLTVDWGEIEGHGDWPHVGAAPWQFAVAAR